MSYIVVKGTVRHNGEVYKSGDKISELSKEESARLLELGVVKESEPADSTNKKVKSDAKV